MSDTLNLQGKRVSIHTVLDEYEGFPLLSTITVEGLPYLMLYHDVSTVDGVLANTMMIMPLDHASFEAFANKQIHAIDLMSLYYSASIIHLPDQTDIVAKHEPVTATMYMWDPDAYVIRARNAPLTQSPVIYPYVTQSGIDIAECVQSDDLCYQFPSLVIDGVVVETEKVHQPASKVPDAHAGKVHSWYRIKFKKEQVPKSFQSFHAMEVTLGVTLFEGSFANIVAVQLAHPAS